MNYDLQILLDYLKQYSYRKVVIAFQDSEAFDGNLVSELLGLFKYVGVKFFRRKPAKNDPAPGEIGFHSSFSLVSQLQ